MESLLDKLEARAAEYPPSLQLKLLVVADCAGADAQQAPLKVTPSGASGLLESLKPRLQLTVENRLQNLISGARKTSIPNRWWRQMKSFQALRGKGIPFSEISWTKFCTIRVFRERKPPGLDCSGSAAPLREWMPSIWNCCRQAGKI
jgi:hypothetical protein